MAMKPASGSLGGLMKVVSHAPSQKQPPTQGGQDTGKSESDYQGPDQAPFKCANCTKFDQGSSGCTDDQVIQDQGDRGDGMAQVDAEGCCNEFDSLSANGHNA